MATSASNPNSAEFQSFVQSIGYEVFVCKGQRLFRPVSPHFDSSQFDQAKRHEIFISRLPNNLYEEELLPFLNRVGPVYQTRLILNFSGKTKGCAYVVFANVSDSYRAVEMLNNQYIRPNHPIQVRVTFSVNNNRLQISNLCAGFNADEVKSELSKYLVGVESVQLKPSCRVLDLPESTCINSALVTFRNHQFAAAARRSLIPGSIQLWGRTLVTEWARPKQFSTLFVRLNQEAGPYLDSDPTAEHRLRQWFEFAETQLVKLTRTNNYVFVEYQNFDQALSVHRHFRAIPSPLIIDSWLRILQVSWPNRK